MTTFFADLGLGVEGRTFVEGEFIDTVVGIPPGSSEVAPHQRQRYRSG